MPELLQSAIELAITLFGAYFAAVWLCVAVWTIRDIRSRTTDGFVQFLCGILVILFNLPGFALYLILRPPETLADAEARAARIRAAARPASEACPRCHGPIESDYRVCPRCRTALREPCVACGRLMSLEWQACPYCATQRASAPE